MASFVAPTDPIASGFVSNGLHEQHLLMLNKNNLMLSPEASSSSSISSCVNHDGGISDQEEEEEEEDLLEEELLGRPRPGDMSLATSLTSSSSSSSSSTSSSSACSSFVQGVTIPHLSFATDLLLNDDQVETNCSRGLCTQQNLVTLLKARIQLEQLYARELKKIATASHLEELEPENTTLKHALGQMKAQYLNTSVQHEILAKNLMEDVLRPIESLYEINRQKANNLHKLLSNIKKQAKIHEEAYRKEQAHFEKLFKEASNAFNAAMENGFASSMIEEQYHELLHASRLQDACAVTTLPHQSNLVEEVMYDHLPPSLEPRTMVSEPESSKRSSSSVSSSETSNPSAYSMMRNRRSLNLSKSNNGKKLVNWLLPTDSSRKESICSNAVRSLEAAELARVNCRMIWRAVEASRIEMYRAIQSVLTEYQQIAEHRISNLTTNLRKHVIFESSLLANEQYDWQMLARNIEDVDFEGDIREFILANQRAVTATMTIHHLCRIDPHRSGVTTSPCVSKLALPPKIFPLEIRDVAVRKIPVDTVGNQEKLGEVLVTRLQQDAPLTSRHPSQGQPKEQDDGQAKHEEQKEQQEAKVLRVSVAKDVAKAIAKAYEMRAVKKRIQGALLSSESSVSEEREAEFPEDLTTEGVHGSVRGSDLEEFCCSTSSTSVPCESEKPTLAE